MERRTNFKQQRGRVSGGGWATDRALEGGAAPCGFQGAGVTGTGVTGLENLAGRGIGFLLAGARSHRRTRYQSACGFWHVPSELQD